MFGVKRLITLTNFMSPAFLITIKHWLRRTLVRSKLYSAMNISGIN